MATAPTPSGQSSGVSTGLPHSISLQQMADLVNALSNLVRASGNIAQILSGAVGITGFAQPPALPAYTVATLPAITLANVGSIAFATNARGPSDGSSAGKGTTVQVVNNAGTALWVSVWSGVAPTT